MWTIVALTGGIILGAWFPGNLAPVASLASQAVRLFVLLAPLLILVALAPAIARLCRTGRASSLAGRVIGWYLLTSIAAGLLGACVSALLFNIPVTSSESGMLDDALQLLRTTLSQTDASWPVIAIVLAFIAGIIGGKWDLAFRALEWSNRMFTASSRGLYYVIVPFVFCLGTSIGIRFGAKIGMTTYLTISFYTAALCLLWSCIYLLFLKWFARESIWEVITRYYLPVAVVAAGTCSSIATLPFNLDSSRRYGVSPEVSSFVIPFGSIVNMDASVIAYIAYAPFVLTHVFNYPLSWTVLLIAWPAIVLFTISAPGLPAGMGTALWSATLFASLLGLEGDAKIEFIETWIALSGGIPDMLRTATNCTSDGFTAILFNHWSDGELASEPVAVVPQQREANA
ncbi:dicarboxylate/amino acid:cation symporter [Blastopirellula sp. J2-11]|uniref:dicarboxylate/amino acid:cation symporter n=1 Tax=Blastopirellula sp. J2-11 TaxID=2943192 RepID=UPI0021C8F89B|nr:dicarboxylate/amino acid:cation symporter [Blastopirellula sp. J2-11]UUO07739.1 dicarboxylate/amino acid:cation symporter [Blastopirellula sp. J2-11]